MSSSTKLLTEAEISRRIRTRPLSLISGSFTNTRSPAKWKCSANKAHGIFSATPKQILHTGFNCPKCGKAAKLTESLVAERLVGRPLNLIKGTLRGSDLKAKWKCLSDRSHPIWVATPSSVLNKKSGCPVCSGKLPLTEKVLKQRLEGRGIAIVSRSYDPKTRRASFRCLANRLHEHWNAGIRGVLSQESGCPTCQGNKQITESDAKKRLRGRKIELVPGTLNGARRKASWKCLNDLTHPSWLATPSSVLNGSECPACTGHEKLTPEVVKRKLKSRQVSLISRSIRGSNFKASWACLANKQHRSWSATVASVLAGSGCPECSGNAKLTESEINKRLRPRKIRIFRGTFESSSKYAQWICLADRTHPNWKANVGSILGGVGCPMCAEYGFKEHESAFIYILKIGNRSSPLAIKVGITNNHPRFRKGQISRRSDHHLALHKHWQHESGRLIRKIETTLRTKFPHKDLGDTFVDGKTETYFAKDLPRIEREIMKLLKN